MRVRRRSFGDFVKAFLAFVVLLVLVVGVPFALAVSVGWPLPGGAPSLDWLQREITVSTFLHILTVIVWLAWAQFTACVLVEVKAALSGVGVPGRVPGSGPSQLLARQLVAALLLVGATAASLTPGLSQLGQSLEGNQKPSVAAAQQTPGIFAQQQEQAAATANALAEQAGQAGQAAARADGGSSAAHGDTKYYRIQPPEGRHHDSLWEVAERHLGDGRRYKEIFELNKDRVQPDGSRLSEASLIRPGWIMEMPGDARGGELVEMPDEAPNVSEQVQQQISDYARTGDHAQGGGGQQGSGDAQVSLPEQRPAPTPANPVTPATPVPGTGGEHAAPAAGQAGHSFGLPEALLAAPLLAAGLLGALGRRRRQAMWQSALGAVGGRRGMEPPTPTGAPTDAQRRAARRRRPRGRTPARPVAAADWPPPWPPSPARSPRRLRWPRRPEDGACPTRSPSLAGSRASSCSASPRSCPSTRGSGPPPCWAPSPSAPATWCCSSSTRPAWASATSSSPSRPVPSSAGTAGPH
ncbi:hypothetical protein STENM36S_04050 [Streptomyces tendae]